VVKDESGKKDLTTIATSFAEEITDPLVLER